MENITSLIYKYWRTVLLVLAGIILIVYIALGFLYFQQGINQKEAERQINQIRPVLAKPASSQKELQAEYDEITQALTPISDVDLIKMLVTIASESGIDIDEDAGKFKVPPATYGAESVGGNTYRVMSFKNIDVQGAHSDVMDFLSAVQSGSYLKTMVLKKVNISAIDIQFTGEEGARRAEFADVMAATEEMMVSNGISVIPKPISYTQGAATNFMGDNPDTPDIVEGFPDITTTALEKGYTGSATPRNGYVLYNHDLISTDNTSQYETVSYYRDLKTDYYYTCESNGVVRQWNGSNVKTATEYYGDVMSVIETRAIVDISIYSEPQK
jgi:hypothetical protein